MGRPTRAAVGGRGRDGEGAETTRIYHLPGTPPPPLTHPHPHPPRVTSSHAPVTYTVTHHHLPGTPPLPSPTPTPTPLVTHPLMHL